jgi:hypothetical protein
MTAAPRSLSRVAGFVRRASGLGLLIGLGMLIPSTCASLALPIGDCSSEGGLVGRTDIVLCEPWENPNWWQVNGYTNANRTAPSSTDAQSLSIVSSGCVSGSCLKVVMPTGQTDSMSLKWPLEAGGFGVGQPEALYLRYYMKLFPAFDPNLCDTPGHIYDSGGKFPGLADERIPSDPVGQCGNGGDPADGINCWTMRALYHGCDGNCGAVPGAVLRYGSYLYFYRQEAFTGSHAPWDGNPADQFTGDGGTCQTTSNNVYCGNGTGGMFIPDRWYLVEMFVKMNTVTSTAANADGIIRGWIDGVLNYEKTNMIFRIPGNDNLHVHRVWLNVYKGGIYGNCTDTGIYLDQMVVATNAQIGPFMAASHQRPSAPINFRVSELWRGLKALAWRETP